jgi:hypothetical protein
LLKKNWLHISYPSPVFPEERRQPVDRELREEGGDVVDQVAEAVLAAVLRQASAEGKQRDDLSPRDVARREQLLGELGSI